MNKAAKKTLSILLALAMLFGLVACGNSSSDKDDAATDTIKIAVPAYLTGQAADYGEYVMKSVELAIQNFNEAGGLNGKMAEAIYEDQGQDQQSYINCMMKITNYEDITAIIGNAVSTHTLAVADLVAECRIPYFTCGSSIAIADLGNKYIWQPRMTDDLAGSLLAKTAIEDHNVKHPAVVYQDDAYGQGYRDAVVAYYASQGLTTAIEVQVNSQETNFAPIFTQIINSGCDGLICANSVTQTPLVLQAAKNADFAYPRLMSGAMCSAEAFELAGTEACEGWISLAEWSNDADTEAAQKYVAEYTELAGRVPNVLAVYAYDATCLALEAVKIAGSDDPAAVNEALAKIDAYPGAMATMTSRDNHNFGDTLYSVVLHDGVAVVNGVVSRPE